MSIHTTLPLTYIGLYENDISLGYGIGIPAGSYIYRDNVTDSIHNNSAPESHPEQAHLIKNKNRNVMLKGAWDFEWEWADGDFTEEQIDQAMAIPVTHPNTVFSKDFLNHKLTLSTSNADVSITSWSDLRQAWVLGSNKAGITAVSNDSAILCVTILNGEYDNYTIESITVEPGTSATIDKVGSSHCYIVLSSDLTKDGVTLQPFNAYKLSSASISVANTGVERTRIVRISK